MQLRHRAALGGAWLDEVDDRIVVQGIKTSAGKTTINAVSLWGHNGQRVTGMQRDTIDVTIEFGLLIRKTNMAARAELLDAVNAWAAGASRDSGGAWLTVNYKENRQIHVVLVEPAEEGDLKEWTNTFSIVFRAYGVPYWQETGGASATSSAGTTRVLTLTVGGNAKTAAEVELTNTSGSQIDTATIIADASKMVFSDLALASNETLVIDHDDEGRPRIRIRNTGGVYRSAMAKRSGTSANDLYIMPGSRTISFTAQRTCTMTATVRGRFL